MATSRRDVRVRAVRRTIAALNAINHFLGAEEKVAAVWADRVTKKIRARYGSWLAQGGARTLFGKNIVVKNSVMAVAWWPLQLSVSPWRFAA